MSGKLKLNNEKLENERPHGRWPSTANVMLPIHTENEAPVVTEGQGAARYDLSRLRWMNYLKPNVNRGNFSQEQEETLIPQGSRRGIPIISKVCLHRLGLSASVRRVALEVHASIGASVEVQDTSGQEHQNLHIHTLR
ncbi:hypothetical protein Tco_1137464 [Tanacetum coccineum]